MGWAPLWAGIVDSSIWDEPEHVFKTFIGMLAIKESDDIVWMDSYKLSKRLHIPHEQVLDALRALSSPDTRRPGQPHEGRRIQAVEGGWFILNGDYYREQVRREQQRARNRRAQANWRARRSGKPLPYPNEPQKPEEPDQPIPDLQPLPPVDDHCAQGGVIQQVDTGDKNELARDKAAEQPAVTF